MKYLYPSCIFAQLTFKDVLFVVILIFTMRDLNRDCAVLNFLSIVAVNLVLAQPKHNFPPVHKPKPISLYKVDLSEPQIS